MGVYRTASYMTNKLLEHQTQCELAVKLGSKQAQISRIYRGAEPDYCFGKKIEALYLEEVGEYCDDKEEAKK